VLEISSKFSKENRAKLMEIQNCIAVEQFTEEIKGNLGFKEKCKNLRKSVGERRIPNPQFPFFHGNKNLMVHLNDSKTDFGSKMDRHAVLGFGTVWDYHKPESFESLITLRNYCKDKSYDIILETPSESPETFELNILKR
jgi:hypothetical protein